VEHVRVEVIERNVDWKASFANCTWLILWATTYQVSGSVSADRPKGIVVI